jgi:predicted transglutaminase-like cysteine proteinase
VSTARTQYAAIAAFFLAALPWNSVANGADQLATIEPAPLFGTVELHSNNLKMFPKWRGMLSLFEKERKSCAPDQCMQKTWHAIIDRLRGLDLMTELREINTEMNKRPYVPDLLNWNLPDYWATPFEFLRKGGDCEDFAIAKYMALRELGVPIDEMRIVVLNDANLHIAHAVLAVYVEGMPYILDNQISKVVPASSIHHYVPVYSINENGWWLHRNGGSIQLVGDAAGEHKTAKLF